ncbi:MAG TPA: hypothetical protein VFG86_25870 [Chloroflexota bacterium]|nr:hypothetical protein [Chloroflexota bacterium]
MRQLGVELFLDAPRELVELAQRPRTEQQVQAHREHALLAALQAFAQALCVLKGDLSLRVGDALAAHRAQPRRLEPRDLHAEPAHHAGGGQGSDVQACLDGQVRLDQ